MKQLGVEDGDERDRANRGGHAAQGDEVPHTVRLLNASRLVNSARAWWLPNNHARSHHSLGRVPPLTFLRRPKVLSQPTPARPRQERSGRDVGTRSNARNASSLVPRMSKTRCMRTSSNTARTCFDMPHSFRSPPLAFNFRRQEMKAPKPELSTKRRRLRSSTSLALASSNGAISRLNSPALLASSSSTGTAATATSPTFSKAICIGLSFRV